MEKQVRLLWVDDEIEHLKAHLFFLEEKGFTVDTATNGTDAIDMVAREHYDLVFLDENMPGISGLETLSRLKEGDPDLPVVMITKSEEEDIMEQAIGRKIADYLIKPVNPNQILLTIKKNLDKRRLVAETTTSGYQSEFSRLSFRINDSLTVEDWEEVYRKLVFWELELQSTGGTMDEVLKMQKAEANREFSKFVKKNYQGWLSTGEGPLLSHQLFKNKIFPLLDSGEKVFFLLIDNFRLDQWQMIRSDLSPDYQFPEESLYMSILPTATQFARNAVFAGLMPSQIAQMYPQYWVDDDEEGSKNQFEQELLQTQIDRYRRKHKFAYHKINDPETGKKVVDGFKSLMTNDLNVIVFNFVDILSHARTEMKMIRELAGDEAAYRSLTMSWYMHSSLRDLLKKLAAENVTVVITTDHGTIRVGNPVKVVGDRNVNTNLRYKQGKNLAYNPKEVFEVKTPEKVFLPRPNVSTTYIFATNNDFFAYPNNYNYYVTYYKDTFQHGGVSLEEMIIPYVVLKGKDFPL
ncbi:MAG: bifunctional response regulator/alkaline phosphatase family protein [Breznakibacter sp.]